MVKAILLKPLDGRVIGATAEFSQTDFDRLRRMDAVALDDGKQARAPKNKMMAPPQNKARSSRKKGNDMTSSIERTKGKAAYRRAAAASVHRVENSAAPEISGEAHEGATLSVSNGTWSSAPDAYTYAWLRDGSAIAGADEATYTLTAEDVGTGISARVTAANKGFTTEAVSAATDAVIGLPVFTAPPSIAGTPQDGETLTGDAGEHNGDSATYRWLADEAAIDGETGATLVLATAQVGAAITFEVTATNDAGSTIATSDPTDAVTAAA